MESQMSILEPTNEGAMTLSFFSNPNLVSCSDVSPKGDLVYCGRSFCNGVPIYFIVKHRNYSGMEGEIVNAPIFWQEKEVEFYVKEIDSKLQIKRCPCGCWDALGNKHRIVMPIIMPWEYWVLTATPSRPPTTPKDASSPSAEPPTPSTTPTTLTATRSR